MFPELSSLLTRGQGWAVNTGQTKPAYFLSVIRGEQSQLPPHTSLVGGRSLFAFCPFDSNFVYKDLGRRRLVTEDSREGCAHVLPLSRQRCSAKPRVTPEKPRAQPPLRGKGAERGSKGCG